MKIVAPEDRAIAVTIFEPRQKPEQQEVILQEFTLQAGEEWEEHIPSATAGYRTTPLGDDTRPEDYGQPKPDQQGGRGTVLSSTNEEIEAGRAAQQEFEAREKDRLENPEPTGPLENKAAVPTERQVPKPRRLRNAKA